MALLSAALSARAPAISTTKRRKKNDMNFKFKIPGSPVATIIAALLIVAIVLLIVETNRRERTPGEKIERALDELQR